MSDTSRSTLSRDIQERFLAKVRRNVEALRLATSQDDSDVQKLPIWVQNIRKHLSATICGNIPKVLEEGSLDPYRTGLLIGFEKRGKELIETHLKRMAKIGEKIVLPEDLEDEVEKIGEAFFDFAYPSEDFEGVDILSSGYIQHAYSNLDFRKAQQFFKGMAKGLSQLTDKDEKWNGLRPNTEILLFLFNYWVVVDQEIHTVSELRNWLLRFFPKGMVGDQKRIEGICRAIQLKLRSRGRPTKKKIVRKKKPKRAR